MRNLVQNLILGAAAVAAVSMARNIKNEKSSHGAEKSQSDTKLTDI